MAGIFTYLGNKLACEPFREGLKVRLFNTNVVPTSGSVTTDFNWAVNVTPLIADTAEVVPITEDPVSHAALLIHDDVQFTVTIDTPGQMAYGYCLLDAAGEVLMAQLFDDPLRIEFEEDTVLVQVRIKIRTTFFV